MNVTKPSDHDLPTALAAASQTAQQGQQHTHYYNGRSFPYTIATMVSASLNLLIMLFLLFVVMPTLEKSNRLKEHLNESLREDYEVSRLSYELTKRTVQEVDEYRSLMRRFNALVEQAEKAAAKKKDEDDRKKEDERKKKEDEKKKPP